MTATPAVVSPTAMTPSSSAVPRAAPAVIGSIVPTCAPDGAEQRHERSDEEGVGGEPERDMRRRHPEPKLRPDQAENEKEEGADHGIEVSCNPKPRQREGRDCQAYEKTQQEKKQTELEHATRLLRHDLSFECCPQQRGLTDGRSAVGARHPTTLRLDYGCAGGPLGRVSCAFT